MHVSAVDFFIKEKNCIVFNLGKLATKKHVVVAIHIFKKNVHKIVSKNF
jgi:hypothetical protein